MRNGTFDPVNDEMKPSALTLAERTRLNILWNATSRLSPQDFTEMKRLERRMLAL